MAESIDDRNAYVILRHSNYKKRGSVRKDRSEGPATLLRHRSMEVNVPDEVNSIALGVCPTCGKSGFGSGRGLFNHHTKVHYKTPLEWKVWEKVDIGPPDECWEWQGALKTNGYGKVGNKGERYAHRVMLELVGDEPIDEQVNHHCDNKVCVNPHHLYRGTQVDNIQDSVERHLYAHGEEHSCSKLTADDVIEIRRQYREKDLTYHGLADEYGVDGKTVWNVVHGETWRHVGE